MKIKLTYVFAFLALLLLPSAALAAAPTANFTVTPSTGYAPLTVTIMNYSTGAPLWMNYSFGDGTANGTSLNGFTHTYAAAGNYTIIQTAGNADGNGTLTHTVNVSVLSPLTVTPVVGSTYNLREYSTTSPNVTISGAQGGLYPSVKSAITSGYSLAALGLLALGAVAILRYLNYM